MSQSDSPGSGDGTFPWAALAVLLVAEAILLFLAFSTTPHNGGDNAGYVALAHSLLTRGEYLELWDPAAPPHTKYPPVFPLILAGLIAMGARTWTALKVVSVASALVSLGFLFALARDRRGWAAAMVVGVVFGLSDALVYHSSLILSDLPFLALTLGGLWALERAEGEGIGDEGRRWIVLGAIAAILAFFTRSAGLPLIVAVLGWLALQRRFKALLGFGAAFGIPALAWLLRARGLTGTDYVSEFWLVNPYDPGLGRVGLGGMLGRVGENFAYYALGVFPQGLGGIRGGLGPWVGVVLTGLALAGWFLRVRDRGWTRPGPTELFAPLYFGLILLWPTIWSGDRFALPLLPLLLLYSLDALLRGSNALGRRVSRGGGTPAWSAWVGWSGVAVLSVVLMIPAFGVWKATTEIVRRCRDASSSAGPYLCNGTAWEEFAAAAHWSGRSLPEGSAVLSRKPRIFYVLSGVPGATYPFLVGEEALEEARRGGLFRYVVLDRVDPSSDRYLLPTLSGMTHRLCGMESWTADTRTQGTQLMGIFEAGGEGAIGSEPVSQDVVLAPCPLDFISQAPRTWPTYGSSSEIPLLSAVP